MLQHLIGLAAAVLQPQSPCAPIAHVPADDVRHVPDPDLDPWLDPATAELAASVPRIERRVGDDGVKVDIAIPESLTGPVDRCR